MKMSGRSQWLLLGLAVAVGACARTQPTTTVSTAAGDVGLMDGTDGMWMDGVGGVWMDTAGVLRVGGRTGAYMGLRPAEVARMNNSNILAHVRTSDSLEVVLSRLGMTSASNTAVRNFAQDMIADHTDHMTKETKLAQQTGVAAVTFRPDTTDQLMATRVMNRLSRTAAGPNFDRQFMAAEVMMHRHMLHELSLMQAQVTTPAKEYVDAAAPVVERHLKAALLVQSSLGPVKRMKP
jgi:putative membrane protein